MSESIRELRKKKEAHDVAIRKGIEKQEALRKDVERTFELVASLKGHVQEVKEGQRQGAETLAEGATKAAEADHTVTDRASSVQGKHGEHVHAISKELSKDEGIARSLRPRDSRIGTGREIVEATERGRRETENLSKEATSEARKGADVARTQQERTLAASRKRPRG